MTDKKLIALDIDGTIMFEDGLIPQDVKAEVSRLVEAGHEVMLATGRGAPITLPVAQELEITPKYLVCANGAVILERDETEVTGYRRMFVETFDPKELLLKLRGRVPEGTYAVEDEHGFLSYTSGFPSIGVQSRKVDFTELLSIDATRLILVSADHSSEDFTELIRDLGMHEASYAVGWTAWLDITPFGVNKATALEQVRQLHEIPRELVIAMGDGRNDVEMLSWAGEFGRGIVMGSAPEIVKEAGTEVTESLSHGGSARILAEII